MRTSAFRGRIDMEVGRIGVRAGVGILLAIGCHLTTTRPAHADPLYTAIDLGTGTPTFGNGTVTGSNGQSYTFNPVTNALPSGAGTGPGIPVPIAPQVGWPMTYGNPNYAFSHSQLSAMNAQGLAAGVDTYGVSGHLVNAEAFITQRQPDGSWGHPIGMWQGASTLDGMGSPGVQILGVAANGQVLGIGQMNPYSPPLPTLFLYDTHTNALTNLSNLIDGLPSSPLSPGSVAPNWNLQSVLAQFDNQGRILVQATEGYQGPAHELLLVPQATPGNEVAAPEPSTWLLFAILAGAGWARGRLRTVSRPEVPRHGRSEERG